MKKIIIAAVVMAFSTISAKAADFSVFSLTGGLAVNEGVFGASATETNLTETGTVGHVKEESGVFTDSFSSQFIELGIGSWVSIGYEHTPDSVSTPQNRSNEKFNTTASTVSVDFNDLNTTYLKINTPYGLYFKTGSTKTDLDIKETMQSGSTYKNVSTEGSVLAVGFQKYIGGSGFGVRIEGTHLQLDDVKADSGVTSAQSNGGLNTVAADNLEGLTAKFALTYTLGRN